MLGDVTITITEEQQGYLLDHLQEELHARQGTDAEEYDNTEAVRNLQSKLEHAVQHSPGCCRVVGKRRFRLGRGNSRGHP